MPVLFAKTLVQSLHIRWSFEIHAAEPGWISSSARTNESCMNAGTRTGIAWNGPRCGSCTRSTNCGARVVGGSDRAK
jgi:hypothetical protein